MDVKKAASALKYFGFEIVWGDDEGMVVRLNEWSCALFEPGTENPNLEAAVRSAVLKMAPGSYVMPTWEEGKPDDRSLALFLIDRENRILCPVVRATQYAEVWILGAIALYESENSVSKTEVEG